MKHLLLLIMLLAGLTAQAQKVTVTGRVPAAGRRNAAAAAAPGQRLHAAAQPLVRGGKPKVPAGKKFPLKFCFRPAALIIPTGCRKLVK